LSGTNEMWIAATALVNDQPLVTRYIDAFQGELVGR
jgi:hypothetical protein